MVLEYRDKHLVEWNKTHYGKSLDDLARDEFIAYTEKAFDFFYGSNKNG